VQFEAPDNHGWKYISAASDNEDLALFKRVRVAQ
jgi:hypothetical protein